MLYDTVWYEFCNTYIHTKNYNASEKTLTRAMYILSFCQIDLILTLSFLVVSPDSWRCIMPKK